MTRGQAAFAADIALTPVDHTGAPRRHTWATLPHELRANWDRYGARPDALAKLGDREGDARARYVEGDDSALADAERLEALANDIRRTHAE